MPNRELLCAKDVLLSSVSNAIMGRAIAVYSFKILQKSLSITGNVPRRICEQTPRCPSVSCDLDLVVSVRLFASMTSYFAG